ncbi:MAG: cation-binding protein [Myxococcaceae bacterium]|nr:cation-binding protein [Myxococcaceae bacterium]
MDAITLLRAQHDEVEDLFEEYESAESRTSRRAIFNRLADAIAAHATIEEKLFYPAVCLSEVEDLLKEAAEGHLAARRILADLLDLQPPDGNFDAKVKVLQEQLSHHAEEEEDELFPIVRVSLSRPALEALGEAMGQMFEELMKGTPRDRVRDETDHAAQLN